MSKHSNSKPTIPASATNPTAALLGGLLGNATSPGGLLGAAPADANEFGNKINVTPIGINLGAIMLGYNGGSPENGGNPISLDTPFSSLSGNITRTIVPTVLGIVGISALLLLLRRRRSS